VIFGAACLLAVLLFLFLNKTKIGMAIQATSLDADSARLAGVDIRFVFALTFGLSAALAAAAGSLLSIVQPTYPYMDVAIIGKAFAVAVLGGLGNVPGAIAGGFVLAIAEESVGQFIGVQYTQVVAYAILVVILVLRPTGLFGREYFAEVRV
jgi:branched-chain amino acid transport system permease protein